MDTERGRRIAGAILGTATPADINSLGHSDGVVGLNGVVHEEYLGLAGTFTDNEQNISPVIHYTVSLPPKVDQWVTASP